MKPACIQGRWVCRQNGSGFDVICGDEAFDQVRAVSPLPLCDGQGRRDDRCCNVGSGQGMTVVLVCGLRPARDASQVAAGRVLGHTIPVEERGRELRGRHVGASRKMDGKPFGKPGVVFD
jgi:hypothetical protein